MSFSIYISLYFLFPSLASELFHRSCNTYNNKNSGYHLVNTSCVQWGCESSSSGPGCETCESVENRIDGTSCKTCNSGFYLENKKCFPYGCVTSTEDDCSNCVDQMYRFDHETCSECYDGHYLDESTKKCVAWECHSTTDEDNGCKECVSQLDRIDHETCSECHSGHYLDDVKCVPWHCTLICFNRVVFIHSPHYSLRILILPTTHYRYNGS